MTLIHKLGEMDFSARVERSDANLIPQSGSGVEARAM